MRILIAEDDFASRKFIFKLLLQFGESDMTVDGIEAVEAFMIGHDIGKPYDLICLDIMMPRIDGIKALETIRNFEKQKKIGQSDKCKVIMISALNETEVVFDSFNTESEAYVTKPINIEKFEDAMKKLGLIK